MFTAHDSIVPSSFRTVPNVVFHNYVRPSHKFQNTGSPNHQVQNGVSRDHGSPEHPRNHDLHGSHLANNPAALTPQAWAALTQGHSPGFVTMRALNLVARLNLFQPRGFLLWQYLFVTVQRQLPYIVINHWDMATFLGVKETCVRRLLDELTRAGFLIIHHKKITCSGKRYRLSVSFPIELAEALKADLARYRQHPKMRASQASAQPQPQPLPEEFTQAPCTKSTASLAKKTSINNKDNNIYKTTLTLGDVEALEDRGLQVPTPGTKPDTDIPKVHEPDADILKRADLAKLKDDDLVYIAWDGAVFSNETEARTHVLPQNPEPTYPKTTHPEPTQSTGVANALKGALTPEQQPIATHQLRENRPSAWMPSQTEMEKAVQLLNSPVLVCRQKENQDLLIAVADWLCEVYIQAQRALLDSAGPDVRPYQFLSPRQAELTMGFAERLGQHFPALSMTSLPQLVALRSAFESPMPNPRVCNRREVERVERLARPASTENTKLATNKTSSSLPSTLPSIPANLAASLPKYWFKRVVNLVKNLKLTQQQLVELIYHMVHFSSKRQFSRLYDKLNFHLCLAINLLKSGRWSTPRGLIFH